MTRLSLRVLAIHWAPTPTFSWVRGTTLGFAVVPLVCSKRHVSWRLLAISTGRESELLRRRQARSEKRPATPTSGVSSMIDTLSALAAS